MADGMTPERLDAGRHLLGSLDTTGMAPSGAAWIHDAESEVWFFLLVTPLIDELGPYWIYERLMRLFALRPLPEGISPLDLRIYSPLEAGIVALARAIRVDDGQVEMRNCVINGMIIDHAFIYRMGSSEQAAGALAQRFDENIRTLEAA